MQKATISKLLIPLVAAACLVFTINSAWALLLGLAIALSLGNSYPTKAYIHPLLGLAVAGLGAGMNLETVARVGMQGFGITFCSILGVCFLGYALTSLFRVEREVAILISVGTAICGGSAIAAITPVIRAKHQSVSVALGCVFVLNAIALVIFPVIGQAFAMNEHAFGLWSALAIHDTSSVVGATMAYGKVASEVGTTVKLARALWIVPLTVAFGFFQKRNTSESGTTTKKPWFIAWFILAAALVTWIPALQQVGHWVEFGAKRVLVLTLFLIGLGLSKETIKSVGFRPFLLGSTLWIVTACLSFFLIHNGII